MTNEEKALDKAARAKSPQTILMWLEIAERWAALEVAPAFRSITAAPDEGETHRILLSITETGTTALVTARDGLPQGVECPTTAMAAGHALALLDEMQSHDS